MSDAQLTQSELDAASRTEVHGAWPRCSVATNRCARFGSSSNGSPTPTRPCSSPERAAPARVSSRATFTPHRLDANARSSRSTARRCHPSCWNPSSSVSNAAHSPARFKHRPGKFEFAHQGTMFLDEISELTLGLQSKLLQVLQDGEFARLGGREDVHVDVRVVAATNQDLERAVSERTFREDLFFRLNVVCITLPPLRQRRDEIPLLTECVSSAVRGALQQAAADGVRRHAADLCRLRLARQRSRTRERRQAHGHPRRRRAGRAGSRRHDGRPQGHGGTRLPRSNRVRSNHEMPRRQSPVPVAGGRPSRQRLT